LKNVMGKKGGAKDTMGVRCKGKEDLLLDCNRNRSHRRKCNAVRRAEKKGRLEAGKSELTGGFGEGNERQTETNSEARFSGEERDFQDAVGGQILGVRPSTRTREEEKSIKSKRGSLRRDDV